MKKSYLVGLAAGVLVLCGVVIANAAYIDFENIDIGSVGTCSTGLEPTCVFQSQGFIFSFTAQFYAPLSNISNMIIADKTIYTTVQNETKFLMTTRIPELMINQLHPFTINFEPAAEVSFDLDLSNPLAGYRIDALDANGQLISSIYATSDGCYNFVNYTTLISSLRSFGDSVVAGFAIDNIQTTAPVPEPPFCVSTSSELHNALTTAANNGQDDIIRLVQGTYNGNFIYTSTETYGVTIEGGYTASCSSRVVNPENTVLDAGGSGPVLVLSSPNVVANFDVSGLTLQTGQSTEYGGGLNIIANSGDVTVVNNIIQNNSAYMSGGGISVQNAHSVIINKNAVNYNFAQSVGGIYIWNSSNISLSNNDINYNSETNCCSDSGAVYIGHGSPNQVFPDEVVVINNRLSHNNTHAGLSIRGTRNNVTLTNNVICQNNFVVSSWGGSQNLWYFTKS